MAIHRFDPASARGACGTKLATKRKWPHPVTNMSFDGDGITCKKKVCAVPPERELGAELDDAGLDNGGDSQEE